MIRDYITERDEEEFCSNCNDICSRCCVIYRKAEQRQDREESKRERERERSANK